MAWLDETEFRAIYVMDSATDLPEALIPNCLQSAINRISKLIPATTVTAVDDAVAGSTDQSVTDLREAQELFAYSKLLHFVSGRFNNGGIVAQEHDPDAAITNRYSSLSEIEKKRASLEAEAAALIAPYGVDPIEDATRTAVASGSVPIRVVF